MTRALIPAVVKLDFGDGEEGDRRYANHLLGLLACSAVLFSWSMGVLTVSFPVIVRHFDASATQASWLVLGAMLATTSFIVIFGRLADMFGRIPFYFAGMASLAITSVLAGLAPTMPLLIAARIAQAIGVTMLPAVLAAMVMVSTPPERLSRNMGIYMSALASSGLAGPPLGSLLAETVGWRWLFFFQAPLALALIVWAMKILRPMPPVGERGRMDVAGGVLLALSMTGLIVALSRLQTAGLTSIGVVLCLGLFAVGLPAFLILENRRRSPLIDLGLFRRRSIAASNAAMLLGNMARTAVVLIAGLYFQAMQGDSTLEAALKVLPLPVATTLAGMCMGRISAWGSERAIATVAQAVSGAGMLLLLPALSQGWGYPVLLAGMLITGFGGGVFMPANTTAMLQEVPRERIGVVNAVRMMLLLGGGAVATALSLALLTSAVAGEYRSSVLAGTLSQVAAGALGDLQTGYLRALIVLNVLSVAGIATAYIAQRSYRPVVAAAPG